MDPENIHSQDEVLLCRSFVRCDQLQWKIRHLRIRQRKGSWEKYPCGAGCCWSSEDDS